MKLGTFEAFLAFNGVSSSHTNAKVIEILEMHLPLLRNNQCEGIPAFQPDKLPQPKHRLI